MHYLMIYSVDKFGLISFFFIKERNSLLLSQQIPNRNKKKKPWYVRQIYFHANKLRNKTGIIINAYHSYMLAHVSVIGFLIHCKLFSKGYLNGFL